MLNKKGFFITPILFVIFLLIAISLYAYNKKLDDILSYEILKSSVVEKGIHEIRKKQINQITYAELLIYKCAEEHCFNFSNPSNVTLCEKQVEENLTKRFGNNTWNLEINNYTYTMNLKSINATNINMTSDIVKVRGALSKNYLKCD